MAGESQSYTRLTMIYHVCDPLGNWFGWFFGDKVSFCSLGCMILLWVGSLLSLFETGDLVFLLWFIPLNVCCELWCADFFF